LLNSVQFRLFGKRALKGAPFTVLALALLPLSFLLNRARGGGDELAAAAVRPSGR
jgi:hypothetical protein